MIALVNAMIIRVNNICVAMLPFTDDREGTDDIGNANDTDCTSDTVGADSTLETPDTLDTGIFFFMIPRLMWLMPALCSNFGTQYRIVDPSRRDIAGFFGILPCCELQGDNLPLSA